MINMSCHLLSIKLRAIFLIFSSILLSNLSQTSGQVQVRECPMNDWCQSPQASSFPLAYYKFIVMNWNMTWFEALEECRNEGNGSELLVIDSASESAWVKQMIARQTYKNNLNDRMWYVNAHKYLYNSHDPAWADGSSLSPLEIGITSTDQPKNCSVRDMQFEVENECLGFVVKENADLSFADVNCTSKYTSRAICKRSILSKDKSKFENSVTKFNRNEWVQSTRNKRLFYRFISVERDAIGKSILVLSASALHEIWSRIKWHQRWSWFRGPEGADWSELQKRKAQRSNRLLCESSPLFIQHAQLDVGRTAECG